jgi:1,4-dihydroxy-2-naphthoyl-CoA hydrolase
MPDAAEPPEFPDFDPRIAEAIVSGAALPSDELTDFLGFRMLEVGPGMMRGALGVRPGLLNPFGLMHGGVVSALVDHMLGAVCYSAMPVGYWAATTEFKVNFLAPVREGEVEATARIISKSTRTAVVRVDVCNGDRLVAAAQGTVTLQPPKA